MRLLSRDPHLKLVGVCGEREGVLEAVGRGTVRAGLLQLGGHRGQVRHHHLQEEGNSGTYRTYRYSILAKQDI